ncbi:MAG: hypothetical protein Q4B30_03120 [Coriobacteriaceae bacterium]|nr:hypothetical protein [Coriobacteriaceae bacterium]
MNEQENKLIGLKICELYLFDRGYEVLDKVTDCFDMWHGKLAELGDCPDFLVARDSDTEEVVLVLCDTGDRGVGRWARAVDDLEALGTVLGAVRELSGKERIARMDVVGVNITGDTTAKLDHLVGVC